MADLLVEVKQSNALNRRRITVQLPPLLGLLSGLRCLTLGNETSSSKIRRPGLPFPSLGFCVFSLLEPIVLGVGFDSPPPPTYCSQMTYGCIGQQNASRSAIEFR